MIVDTLNTVHLWWGLVQPIHLSTESVALDDNYSSHNVHYRRRNISSLRRLLTHNRSCMSLSHGGYHRSSHFRFELQTALHLWTLRPARLSRNDQAVGRAKTKWLKRGFAACSIRCSGAGFPQQIAVRGFTKQDLSKFGNLPQLSAESCVAPRFSADSFLYAEKTA